MLFPTLSLCVGNSLSFLTPIFIEWKYKRERKPTEGEGDLKEDREEEGIVVPVVVAVGKWFSLVIFLL